MDIIAYKPMNSRLVLLPDGSWIDYRSIASLIPKDATPKSKNGPAKPPTLYIIWSGRGDFEYECKSLDEAKQIAADLAQAINSAP